MKEVRDMMKRKLKRHEEREKKKSWSWLLRKRKENARNSPGKEVKTNIILTLKVDNR